MSRLFRVEIFLSLRYGFFFSRMDCLLCDHVPWKYGDGMYVDNLYSLDLVLYHTEF